MASNDFVLGLKCRVCGKMYPKTAKFYCDDDTDRSKSPTTTRKSNRTSAARNSPPAPAQHVALPRTTPARRRTAPSARKSAERRSFARIASRMPSASSGLWIKNDAVNFPTLSFKDRVVSVALSKAREFGMRMVGCASTGNLANSVAALDGSAGLETVISRSRRPGEDEDLRHRGLRAKVVKVSGTYDQVNRLCTQIVQEYGWGFVNVNLRPFYAEGSKTFGFEIAEDLGWRFPQHVVCPMAGGALIGKIYKAFKELQTTGIVDQEVTTKMYGAQATGCNPISDCVKSNRERHKPINTPNTICKSLAIGDPADGYFAAKLIRETGGWAEDATDPEIVDAMQLLAKTEGIFAETAGGATLAVAKKLIEAGRIPRNEEIVICITGNGLKTQDAVFDALEEPVTIKPTLGGVQAAGGTRFDCSGTGAGVTWPNLACKGDG